MSTSQSFSEIPCEKAYRLLHPRLVSLIVVSGMGRTNVMPVAWTMPVSVEPPLLAIAVSPKRFTYELLRKSGDFTLNVVPVSMVTTVSFLGKVSGRDVDKISRGRLTLSPSRIVKSPRLSDPLAWLECKIEEEFPTGDHQLIIGRIVAAAAREGMFKERYDPVRAKVLLHLGGNDYATLAGKVVRPSGFSP